MLTTRQINLIRKNFKRIAPQAESTATVFYNRLFATDPALRRMFPQELSGQKQKLMAALAVAIKSLDDPATLSPVLKELGRKHALYGVRPEHYRTVSAALLQTLRDALGAEFTAEARTAWTEMYNEVAAIMKESADSLIEVETEFHLRDTVRIPKNPGFRHVFELLSFELTRFNEKKKEKG